MKYKIITEKMLKIKLNARCKNNKKKLNFNLQNILNLSYKHNYKKKKTRRCLPRQRYNTSDHPDPPDYLS